MGAKEFNELTTLEVEKYLSHLGFKKLGLHFFIHNSPNIMVLYKDTFRGMFEGFCLALTHDFLPNIKNEKGNIKIPTNLGDYPFSIPLTALKEQYLKHNTATEFTYDTNFISRVVLTTRHLTKTNKSDLLNFYNLQNESYESEEWIKSYIDIVKKVLNLQNDPTESKHYIKSSIDIVLKDGMKLLNEFSPVISYLAVTRHKNADDSNGILNKFRTELEKYLVENKIEIPKLHSIWSDKIFNN